MPNDQKPDEQRTLRGVLTRVFQYKDDDGWMTGIASSKDEKGFPVEHKIVGKMPEYATDCEYQWFGRVVTHPKYGEQFAFHSYQTILPLTKQGIFMYLWKTTRWLGMSRAQAVVDAYGTDALEILKTDPQRVAQDISGITHERAREISIHLVRDEETQAARVWLEGEIGGVDGVPRHAIGLLLERYGATAADVVRTNPYRLTEVGGIGWKTVDLCARKMGYDLEGYERRLAASIEAMKMASNDGHTYMPRHMLRKSVRRLLGGVDPGDAFEDATAFGNDLGWLQLPKLAEAERRVVNRIRRLMGKLDAEFPPPPEMLQDDQVDAWEIITTERFCILTGPPGTGKTTEVAEIVRAERSMQRSVLMCAPTGKAAKQMQEAMHKAGVHDIEASTIHAALGGRIKNGKWVFAYDRDTPLDVDTVICDEASMLDIKLFADLIEAIGPDKRLVLVGDEYQIPSVQAGSVLRDLVTFGVPHARLESIKRFAGDLVKVVHAIGKGRPMWMCPFSEKIDLDAGHNIRWLPSTDSEQIAHWIPQLLNRMADYDLNPQWDAQIITPLNTRGPLSVNGINEQLREHFLPDVEEHKGQTVVVGEKVIQTKNKAIPLLDDPNKMALCVNGDLGEVVECDPDENRVVVKHFNPDRVVVYPWKDHNLKPAWAMTIHKCQGSGFPVVILPLHQSLVVRGMWSRNLLYTAISRAEQMCFLVGDREVFEKALPVDATDWRKTLLVERLEKAFDRERKNKPREKGID